MEYLLRIKNFSLPICLVVLCTIAVDNSNGYHATKNPRIVIVGAGPAGIAAASKLFEYGFKNVTILEAEGRIGGRIHTELLGKYACIIKK